MSFEWKKTQVFYRDSNLYSFTKNPLFRKNQYAHIYMPWCEEIENELMFHLKDLITSNGHCYIPLMDIEQKSFLINPEEVEIINVQAKSGIGETHLVMSNSKSIHVFRLIEISHEAEVMRNEKTTLSSFHSKKFKYWLKVDDIFVLDVNHIGNQVEVLQNLTDFINEDQIQNVFSSVCEIPKKKITPDGKWIKKERSLTYEYFIRSCELKDNIYQDAWDYYARMAQHELINCELLRQKCVFQRGEEKWASLQASFYAYQDALIHELNDIYILPLVNAILNFESLNGAWKVAQEGLINKRLMYLLKDILDGESSQIDNLEDFLFFTKNAKSFYYSLKNQFSKKFHKEEFLLVENFLEKQEALIDSFHCRRIADKITLINHLNDWVENCHSYAGKINLVELKNSNLKLSHLLSIMVSANSHENIFFQLVEEKTERATSLKSFDEEVRGLTFKYERDIA